MVGVNLRMQMYVWGQDVLEFVATGTAVRALGGEGAHRAPDGRAFTDSADHTCNNWTSSGEGTAMLGHFDRTGGPNTSWNAAHPSAGCSQEALVRTGGAGLFYCLAINNPKP